MQSSFHELLSKIKDLAHDALWDDIRPIINALPCEDIAEILNALPADLIKPVFNQIDEELKPDTLSELEDRVGMDVIESLSNDELADIFEDMAPDDAADIIAELDDTRSEQVLNLMEQEESEDVRRLLSYDEESAGGIMTTDIIVFPGSLIVSKAIKQIAYMDVDEPFYTAYIVDEQNRLIGRIGLWELLKERHRKRTMQEICHSKVISATADMDQEAVARLMSKYDMTSIPVVDHTNCLLGRITIDDIMDVVEEEATEDLFRFAGSNQDEIGYTSPLEACRSRLPWLLITLGTGFITSSILKHFMADFTHVMVLSFFVPVVMAMGGNTGIQSSTLIIRSISLGALEGRSVFITVGREIATGAIMGIICGLVVAGWAQYMIASEHLAAGVSPLYLALTVGIAMMCAMTFATVFGAISPMFLSRLGADPAVASGPFVTSSNDIFALLIYYLVAVVMLIKHNGALV